MKQDAIVRTPEILATGRPTAVKYRFLLIHAFSLPEGSPYLHRPVKGPKEARLMNFSDISHLLDDVDWEVHPGPMAPNGNWPVESREEFALMAAGRLPIVREACQSGRYNAIVLLGGGEPGSFEAREIARPYGIPVTSCAWAQMHVATMLGNKFSVIDIAEQHNMYYHSLIIRHRMDTRCASIRNVNFPLPRPGYDLDRQFNEQKAKALRGQRSEMVEAALEEALAAIEEDGADVITLGCSAAFWLQPILQERLATIGWEVPVLEGYRCAIELAKLMVDLRIDASGLMYPGDNPKKWRRKKTF